VDIGDHDIVAADAQLATDYQSVSSQNPPAKKARDKCAVSLCLVFFVITLMRYATKMYSSPAKTGFMTRGLLL
jgi:hypothetical protein